MTEDQALARQGRIIALVIAGTAIFWIIATAMGAQLGLSQRLRALFDLMALAGFLWAFWLIFSLWRARQGGKG